MTLQHKKGGYEIECNYCGDILEVDGNFSDVLRELELEGWKSKQIDGEWLHYCLDCQLKGWQE